MSKPAPARYRTTDWSEYNGAFRRRGSLLVWLDREMEWAAPERGRPGRPRTFSDAAIQFCLSIKVLFGLALRQTIGMVECLLRLAGLEDWPVPDYSTLCRRQKTVSIQIPFRRSGDHLNLLVDSTGVKVRGDGEWQVRKHGPGRRRQWRKVHLAMDTATGDIRAVEFTSSQTGDSPVLPGLLAQIPSEQPIGTVTADGAYDTRTCRTAIAERGGTAVIPIRKNGRAWKEDGPAARARNEPPSLKALRPGPLEATDGLPRPKSSGGADAAPQVLRRTHRLTRPRSPSRRDPHPHRLDEPLLGPRQGRDHARRLSLRGKGRTQPQPEFCNNATASVHPKWLAFVTGLGTS